MTPSRANSTSNNTAGIPPKESASASGNASWPSPQPSGTTTTSAPPSPAASPPTITDPWNRSSSVTTPGRTRRRSSRANRRPRTGARVSVGEIAGLVAAGAFVLLVVLVAVPLLKLGRTLDETTLTIRQVREQSAPILGQASTTVAHVNSNLERVDDITGKPATVSSNVAALSSVVAATLGSPLIKVAAFSYGVRSAAKKKREGQALADAARRDKDERRARRAARRAA